MVSLQFRKENHLTNREEDNHKRLKAMGRREKQECKEEQNN